MMKRLIAVLLTCALLYSGVALAGTMDYPITFKENPTTGYQWTYAVSDDTVLDVADEGYVQTETAEPMVGVGGTHTWVISGLKEGEESVTFTYARSWESNPGDPVITYTFQVDADKNLTLVSAKDLPEQYMPNMAVIRLIENPTTGYEWTVEASQDGILKPVSDNFATDENSDGAVGAGGVHTWIYSGESEGTVTLTFNYARSFEPDEKPVATVTFTYDVDAQLNVTLVGIDGDYEQYDPDAQQ